MLDNTVILHLIASPLQNKKRQELENIYEKLYTFNRFGI